jgi:hypothetical protein
LTVACYFCTKPFLELQQMEDSMKISFHHLTGVRITLKAALETNKPGFHTGLSKLEYIHAGKGNSMHKRIFDITFIFSTKHHYFLIQPSNKGS